MQDRDLAKENAENFHLSLVKVNVKGYDGIRDL